MAIKEVAFLPGTWKSFSRVYQNQQAYSPRTELGRSIKAAFAYLPREHAEELLELISRVVIFETRVEGTIIRHPESPLRAGDPKTVRSGEARTALMRLHESRDRLLRQRNLVEADNLLPEIIAYSRDANLLEPLGILGQRVVTSSGVNYLVDAWQNLQELENLRYHALGTSSGGEFLGDTVMGTELTTQYNPDNTRATGSLGETGSGNIFVSIGTNTVDATVTVAEHGLFSSANSGGTNVMWDRTVLSPTSGLTSGDSLQTSYFMTATPGG